MRNVAKSKEILIVQNISREGVGILGEILTEYCIRSRILDLSKGEVTCRVDDFGAVIVFGGPDSANDSTSKMLFEIALIRQVLDHGIPYLGICLGLQTLVKAAGGDVVKCPAGETGFRDENGNLFTVELTEDGRKDPLFTGLNDSLQVFQLHGETVIPADGMKLLATGNVCPNQVLKAAPGVYGIQCHFELTEEMFESWIREDPDLRKLDTKKLREDFRCLGSTYFYTGRQLFLNFLRIASFIE
jgi:GMP synthase-like glutamine amidotransferase